MYHDRFPLLNSTLQINVDLQGRKLILISHAWSWLWNENERVEKQALNCSQPHAHAHDYHRGTGVLMVDDNGGGRGRGEECVKSGVVESPFYILSKPWELGEQKRRVWNSLILIKVFLCSLRVKRMSGLSFWTKQHAIRALVFKLGRATALTSPAKQTNADGGDKVRPEYDRYHTGKSMAVEYCGAWSLASAFSMSFFAYKFCWGELTYCRRHSRTYCRNQLWPLNRTIERRIPTGFGHST